MTLSHITSRFLSYLIGAICLASSFNLCFADAPVGLTERTEFDRADLMARHAGYRSELVSGDLRYLRVALHLDTVKITRQEAVEKLRLIDYADAHRAAREVVGLFEPDLLLNDDKQRRALEFAVAPQRLLFEAERQRSFGNSSEHLVTSRTHLYRDEANHNVQGFFRGSCPLFFFQIDWFREIPSEDFVKQSGWSREEDGLLILGAPGARPGEGNRYALDPTDGLPRLQERVFRENGQTFNVSISEQYGVYSGNVLFPAMRADLAIQDDLVASVMMTILERAEFNLALEDQAFSMSVPQGWAWFDMRTADHPGGVFGEPVADVVSFFEKDLSTGRREGLSAELQSESSEGFGAWIPIVLILNGLLLIGFGVVLFRSPG